ncbi:MAG: hypothetical protein KIT72_02655 [Polyangiaceae bacterium]|nr:hypothetical protein [Polyangiaceae bacterium]MCW5789300.1 hypothetical protein [Polyangiaceae bacterium]
MPKGGNGALQRGALAVATLLSASLTASLASGYEAEVTARSDAQFYTLQSPYGDPLLRRRRYTQTLGLTVYDITGSYEPGAPQLSARALLRMDADFGQDARERSPSTPDRYIPGLEQAPLDLMYAYVEGRGYLGGLLGFRAGRQYVVDALGWWSFDGGLAKLSTPAYFNVDIYGGFEQRGGLPWLSTSRFEAQGVYRGDRSGLAAGDWPSFLDQSTPAPAYGFALESSGVHFLSTRLSYRKVINRDEVRLTPFDDGSGAIQVMKGDRVSSERLGYAARVSHESLGSLHGEAVYDLYNQLVSELSGGIDAYVTERLTLGASYDYYLPTFDGDSIWNWFSHNGQTTLSGRAVLELSRRFDVALSGGARLYTTDGDPVTYGAYQRSSQLADRESIKTLVDHFGDVSGGYRWPSGSVHLGALAETGQRGHRYGADLTTRQRFDQGRYDTLLVLSLHDWEDGLRPQRSATSVGYVAGLGHELIEETRVGLEWEHHTSRLVGQRYRVLATLDLTLLD